MIEYGPDGISVTRQEWYKDGNRHREDGPAVIEYREDGRIREEEWWFSDRLHRAGAGPEDGPAVIVYREDGSVKQRTWYHHGRLHRAGGPAEILYGEDGTVKKERWYLYGRRHREDGPAVVWIREDGSVARQWWLAGERLAGPPRPAFAPRPAGHASNNQCPVCLEGVWLPARTVHNPTVYCHACLWEVAALQRRDPLTRAEISPEGLVRLYGDK